MRYALSFSKLDETDVDNIGLRASSLGVLAKTSVPLLSGFVVPKIVFEEFLTQNNLLLRIRELERSVLSDEDAERVSLEVKNMFRKASVPQDIQEYLQDSYSALNLNNKDNNLLSNKEVNIDIILSKSYPSRHLYDNIILNVKGFNNLIIALKSSWASLYSKDELLLRKNFGFKAENCSIIIQKSFRPSICFESDNNLVNDNILLDAYIGLPDVTKNIVKDSYVFSSEYLDTVSESVNNQVYAVWSGEEHGVVKHYLDLRGSQKKSKDVFSLQAARIFKKLNLLFKDGFKACLVQKDDSVFVFLVERHVLKNIDLKHEFVKPKFEDESYAKHIEPIENINNNVNSTSDNNLNELNDSNEYKEKPWFDDSDNAPSIVESYDKVDENYVVSETYDNSDKKDVLDLYPELKNKFVQVYKESFGFEPVSLIEAINSINKKYGLKNFEILRSFIESVELNKEIGYEDSIIFECVLEFIKNY